MIPKILPIYGQFSINSYGLCIALGIVLVAWLFGKNKQAQQHITPDQFSTLIMCSIVAGLAGARALFVLTNWQQYTSLWQMLAVWQGGGSVLGCIIGILCMMPFFVHHYNLSLLAVLDIAALYAPLLHSVSRIGCFLAGCCYGKPTKLFFAITYWHPDIVAPRHIPLHPTQLYSALFLFLLFLLLYKVQNFFQKPGYLLCIYLLLASSERFFIDFLRGDQQFFGMAPYSLLAINQWIALALMVSSCIGLFVLSYATKTHESF
ncbi:MAG: prolipoprotein diacylglyceryl transferase [Candidatus Babeliales bacterium]